MGMSTSARIASNMRALSGAATNRSDKRAWSSSMDPPAISWAAALSFLARNMTIATVASNSLNPTVSAGILRIPRTPSASERQSESLSSKGNRMSSERHCNRETSAASLSASCNALESSQKAVKVHAAGTGCERSYSARPAQPAAAGAMGSPCVAPNRQFVGRHVAVPPRRTDRERAARHRCGQPNSCTAQIWPTAGRGASRRAGRWGCVDEEQRGGVRITHLSRALPRRTRR
eukprot:scaffold158148_cov30-Tisochrysis_lutea.AAC.1